MYLAIPSYVNIPSAISNNRLYILIQKWVTE